LYQDLVNSSLYFQSLEIILLTDQDFEPNNESTRRNIRFKKIFKEYPDWVTATLMRYEALSDYAFEITNQKVFWIDADMRILNFKQFSEEVGAANVLTFARHPGYLNPINRNFLRRLKQNIKKHGLLKIRRIVNEIQIFDGTWEDNKNSTAYVQTRARKKYVHGAFWGGPVDDVLRMAKDLNSKIKFDLEKNYIAVWHDESHLNQYHSCLKNKKYFSRSFSGADTLSKFHRSVIWSIQK